MGTKRVRLALEGDVGLFVLKDPEPETHPTPIQWYSGFECKTYRPTGTTKTTTVGTSSIGHLSTTLQDLAGLQKWVPSVPAHNWQVTLEGSRSNQP